MPHSMDQTYNSHMGPNLDCKMSVETYSRCNWVSLSRVAAAVCGHADGHLDFLCHLLRLAAITLSNS